MTQPAFALLTIREALHVSPEMTHAGVTVRELEQLLLHVLEQSRAFLRMYADYLLDAAQTEAFVALRARLVAGEPLAYVLGTQAFWTLNLKVTAATLIPRPDTEMVVTTILELPLPADACVVDLGTGTGAIALALTSERPTWQMTATDVSNDALHVAKQNAESHGLDHVRFGLGSWYDALDGEGRFDVIVSNPPYIDPDDVHLAGLRHEPITALTAPEHGLADLRHLIAHAPEKLQANGWLVLEHGYDQGAAVRDMLTVRGFQAVRTVRDFGGNDRVSLGQWLSQTAS